MGSSSMEFTPEDLAHAIEGLLKQVVKERVEIKYWRKDDKLMEQLYRMQAAVNRAVELAEHLQTKV